MPNQIPATSEKIKTLVVQSDPALLAFLEQSLMEYSRIDTADSGHKAISLIKESRYDIIFTDYVTDDGNGMDILKYLKESGVKAPVVFVSKIDTAQILTELIHFQVFGIVEDPFSETEIKTIMESAIEKTILDRHNERLIQIGLTTAELLHEINNPLSLISLGAQALVSNPNDPKQIVTIQKGIDRIVRIIETTKAKLRGNVEKKYANLIIGTIFKQAVEEFSAKAAEAGITIEIAGQVDTSLYCDPDGIREVFINLINNAIDAVSDLKEKWIKITVKAGSKGVLITISDSGVGIPDPIKKKIFNTMFTTKGKKGNGLGLGICRRIAHEHGGNLYLVLDAQHTTFALILPKEQL